MLKVHKSPAEKRQALRQGLESGRLLKVPGAFSPLVAMELEELGFDAIYISGAVLSADLGLPDIGLTIFGFASALGFFVPGLKYWRQRRDRRRE